jgi:hypothetical protein
MTIRILDSTSSIISSDSSLAVALPCICRKIRGSDDPQGGTRGTVQQLEISERERKRKRREIWGSRGATEGMREGWREG